MEIKVVIDGTAYEFESYLGLRELLDENASCVVETSSDDGVYF